MTPTQDPRSDERILKAQHLLETWDRLARAHTMIGAGCSCGIGGVVVALEDFEQDIVDYLQAEAERLGRADVLKCLDQTREGNLWSISRLLGGFSNPPDCPSLRLEPSYWSVLLGPCGPSSSFTDRADQKFAST